MADLDNINFNEYEEMQEFELIPEGTYNAVVSNSEVIDLKNNRGKALKMEFTLADGTYKNRKLWNVYSLWHVDNEIARFGRSAFATLCKAALGHANPRKSEELHQRMVVIRVAIKDGFNNIRSTKAVSSLASPAQRAENPRMQSTQAVENPRVPNDCPF